MCIFAKKYSSAEMEFKLTKKEPVTDEAIINEIKSVMNKLGKKQITIREFDANATTNSSTVIRRYGKWNDALIIAGAELSNMFYSDEELLSNIKDAWLKKGIQPTRRDMDNKDYSAISSGTYLRRFGTWYKALDCFVTYITKNRDSDSFDLEVTNDFTNRTTIKHKTKRDPSDRLKVQVLMRDGNKCRICGAVCSGGLHNIHFDHIIPWSKGGETVLENLQVLCSACNEAKGNM